METQVVKSYVRNKQTEVAPKTQSNVQLCLLLGGGAIILIATLYWYITIPLVASVGAAYGIRTLQGQNPKTQVVEALTEALGVPTVKTKRHYNKRMKVRHYQLGEMRV